jgi:hypothetical protein
MVRVSRADYTPEQWEEHCREREDAVDTSERQARLN